MRFLIVLLVFFVPIPTVTQSSQTPSKWPETVSMLQLIANPEKYDGKTVGVVGFLRLEFEGNELYLHKEDYDQRITKNGIWVDLSSKVKEDADKLDMHYVLVFGRFNAGKKGHMDLMSGSIEIAAVTTWPPHGAKNE